MSEEHPHQDLDKLEARLRVAQSAARNSRPDGGPEDEPKESSAALAFRVGVELISAVAVGLGIGWLLDTWLDTRPWLMLVFILLGGAAGILNIFRLTRGYGYAAGYQQEENSGNEDPGDKGPDQGPGIEG